MSRLKTASDIAGIWRSGQIAAGCIKATAQLIAPGVSTAALNEAAHEYITGHGAVPSFLGYNGYPASICVCLNEEIVHGIASPMRLVQPGDLVTLDVGVNLDGLFSDTAWTFVAGSASGESPVPRLLAGTRDALGAGIHAFERGRPLRLVSRAIQDALQARKLGVIRELTGHGVGFAVHEEPTVYNFDPGTRKPLVEDGLVIAIEPMASLGTSQILLKADNWTYVTADGSLAAHFEHTVACWDGQTFILTDPEDDAAAQAFGKAAARRG